MDQIALDFLFNIHSLKSGKKDTFITAKDSSLPKYGMFFSPRPISVKGISLQCQRSSMRIHSDRGRAYHARVNSIYTKVTEVNLSIFVACR